MRVVKIVTIAEAAAALLVSLAGCQLAADKVTPIPALPISTAPTVPATPGQTATPGLPATPAQPAAQVRQVSSPGHVTNDMRPSLGQCRAVTVSASARSYLPDPNCTPGATDPAVSQATIV